MTEREFVEQYVLNRARAIKLDMGGVKAAGNAQRVWEWMNENIIHDVTLPKTSDKL